jgi:pyridoxine kinase
MRPANPRVAAVHDLSGFGRASLTVVIPILSTMGIQVCPLPTAVLSTHTGGFDNYKFIDLTEHLEEYIRHWDALGIDFDCIYSGFLGSPRQIDIISGFIERFRRPEQLIIIDPVMGDNGKLYSAIDTQMVEQMKRHIGSADIITPNYTEAVYLLDESYKNKIEEKEIKDWLLRLSDKGPGIVIITSVPDYKSDDLTWVMAYNSEDKRFWKVRCHYIPASFPGTGDGFTSVIVGSIMQGDSLPIALDRAVQFISAAIRATYGHKYPEREGVLLERVLGNLKMPVLTCTYEIL